MDKDTQDAIAAIKKTQDETTGAITTLAGLVKDLVDSKTKENDETTTVQKSADLTETLGAITTAIQKVQSDVDAILDMEMGSTQVETQQTQQVQKSNDPLAGILFG